MEMIKKIKAETTYPLQPLTDLDMDTYEKEYNEMVQRARELHDAGNALTRQQMEIVCPELRESEDETKSAIDLITEERERQISKGFNWKHDDEHDCHQLSDAAIVYAAPAPLRYQVMNWWPWDKKWLKEDDSFTTEGRIRELIKAGALIVAEIERLQRTINNDSNRPSWKPSEEQVKALERFVDYLHESGNKDYEIMDSFLENLKKL